MYVQSANMQFIHVPIAALKDETVTAESLYHLMKILVCLYLCFFFFLGQKEEENLRQSHVLLLHL